MTALKRDESGTPVGPEVATFYRVGMYPFMASDRHKGQSVSVGLT